MDDATDELDGLRADIDRIDDEIGALVAERMEAAEAVAAVKSRDGRDIVDEDREEAVKSHYEELFRGNGLDADRGRELAEFLIDVSIEREEEIEAGP